MASPSYPLWIGGGIFQLGTEPEQNLTIINSTISGNTARVVGGGLARIVEGEAMIILSTVSQNETNFGDAIFLDTIRRTLRSNAGCNPLICDFPVFALR